MPPTDHLRDLEQAVIGAVLLDPSVSDLIALEAGQMRDPRAQHVWGAIVSLRDAGQPVDTVTILAQLAKRGAANLVGEAYLAECALRVPTAANAEAYARSIRDASLMRQTQIALAEVLEVAKAGETTGPELIGMAMAALAKLDAGDAGTALTIATVVRKRFADLERIAQDRASGKTTLTGITTGISKLDEKLGGYQRGIVTLVGGRPGMGKSSIALAAADAASEQDIGVHVFSFEDGEASYADRCISRLSGVPAAALRECNLTRDDTVRIARAMSTFKARRRWRYHDKATMTASEIVRAVRQLRRENETEEVIVDYLHLVRDTADDRKRLRSDELLGERMLTFAAAAKADNMAYVVLAQLNRELEKRVDKRPTMADFRGSGNLEEYCKCALGMYRGSVYAETPVKGIDYDDDQPPPSLDEFEATAQVVIAKNNNGPAPARVFAQWHGPTTRIW